MSGHLMSFILTGPTERSRGGCKTSAQPFASFDTCACAWCVAYSAPELFTQQSSAVPVRLHPQRHSAFRHRSKSILIA